MIPNLAKLSFFPVEYFLVSYYYFFLNFEARKDIYLNLFFV